MGGLHDQSGDALLARPERVDMLSFTTGDLSITCRRQNGEWRLSAPVNARADTGVLNHLLFALSDVLSGEVITARDRRESGLTLADYGLEPAHGRISWSGSDGERAVWIGSRSPLGDRVYILPEGAQDVISVPARLLEIWPETVETLRDRILFQGDPRRVNRIEIRRPGGFLQAQRGEDGRWRIQQPFIFPANAVVIRQWLERVYEWRIEEFVADDVSDMAVYGLDESAVQVTLWSEGRETGQSLWLNEADPASDIIHARRREGRSVFALPHEALEVARARPNDWRDRSLLSGRARDIQWVRIERADMSLTLEKAPDGEWWIAHPKRWKADPARVNDLLEAWAASRIEEFIDDEGVGESSPVLRIHFAGALPPSEWTKSVAVLDTATESERLRVQRNDEATLYEIDREVLYSTTSDPLYYRNRMVIRISPDDIRQLQQWKSDTDRMVERGPDGQWIRPSGETGALDQAHLHRIAEVLSALQADEFVEERPADWGVYGLSEPDVVWRMHLDPAAGVGRVLWLGYARDDGRHYARTLGEEMVFLLNPYISTLLLQNIWSESAP